ncbi:hypothetical protein [Umezawaea sp. Da 62-37]|uniref:hypothetical protein n=1 Tax=Umezawaea sp. Da 62-37 TaxID=3075927 RepID=UPI0028F720E5|nr:hypothetical protein [Umezawaea sp. Da 62-37]WNV90953.1 hypothetical protein RM788_22535 [Umezawaea sp. Da 62-37]
MSAYSNPATPLVALERGPSNRRWFFYRDWLAQRRSSRLGRYLLDHPCGSSRCYLPTERIGTNANPAITEEHGIARVWEYVPPAQWARWGREYLAPEEHPGYVPANTSADLKLMEGTS